MRAVPVRCCWEVRSITPSTDVPVVGLGESRQHKAPPQPLVTRTDPCWDAQILCNSLFLIPANAEGCLEILQQQFGSSDSKHTKCLMQIKAAPRKYRWHQ